MLGDIIVADATAHGYNWAPENAKIPASETVRGIAHPYHSFLSPDPELLMTAAEFVRDWPSEDVSDTLFFEGGVDFICYHGTPIYDFFYDGHAANHKGVEIKANYPTRSMWYAAINPFELDAEGARAQVDEFVDAGASGLKVYAARYSAGKTIEQRLDDPELAYPMIERAIERGVKTIATHKAIPAGPVRFEPYGVSDMPVACHTFPQINFEVVHAGFAFVEETAFLAAYPNCYFNLETSFALLPRAPRRFADFMAALLAAGVEDRILYSSGMSFAHPLGALRAFREFQIPEDILERHGCGQITDEQKRKILGENFLRMHGIDPDEFRQTIDGDEVSIRIRDGLETPWSNARARLAVTA